MQITPFYAAVFELAFVLLSFRVIRVRQRLKIAIGDGDNPGLSRAIRVHGNFSEYVPFTLLLLSFAEIRTQSSLAIHAACILFLVARISHAYGVSQIKENLRFRVFGVLVTGGVICFSAFLILWDLTNEF